MVIHVKGLEWYGNPKYGMGRHDEVMHHEFITAKNRTCLPLKDSH